MSTELAQIILIHGKNELAPVFSKEVLSLFGERWCRQRRKSKDWLCDWVRSLEVTKKLGLSSQEVLGFGALGRSRGMGWGGRWEGGSGWGIHVNLWLIHVNVWQKPLQYCKVISLQLIKINGKKKKRRRITWSFLLWCWIELNLNSIPTMNPWKFQTLLVLDISREDDSCE